mmetsp:Transcript_43733/g.72684  ORF Transcript_43733/g.72684 Transcript_43733/m.72684 type:complete len:358 (-) Transcript_43733:403-1476(-)
MVAILLTFSSTAMAIRPLIKAQHHRIRVSPDATRCCDSGVRHARQVTYFLREVAIATPPPGLDAAIGLLLHQGDTPIFPPATEECIPLLVPLTRSRDGEITGLLRWPRSETTLPMVRTESRTNQLRLLAPSATAFVHRALALAEAEEADDMDTIAAFARAAGIEPAASTTNTIATNSLAGRVLLRAGPFMQEYESLAAAHLAGGSAQAALITCERNQACFKAWGRPFAFHARMLAEVGRVEEARDVARHALTLPLWTLEDSISDVCVLAGTSVDELVSSLKLKAAGKMTPEQLKMKRGMEERSPEEVALDRASYVLDLVVAQPNRYTWSAIRPQLAELYIEGGMSSFATFIQPDETL